MSRKLLASLILLLLSTPAFAGQTSCVPVFTALNVIEEVKPREGGSFVHPLVSENGSGLFVSRVRLEGDIRNEGEIPTLELTVRFDPAFEGVSLPYNLYTILVISDGRVLNWLDFTDSCRGPGISFFPGREIHVPSVKLIGADPQKLQIMVWGRL